VSGCGRLNETAVTSRSHPSLWDRVHGYNPRFHREANGQSSSLYSAWLGQDLCAVGIHICAGTGVVEPEPTTFMVSSRCYRVCLWCRLLTQSHYPSSPLLKALALTVVVLPIGIGPEYRVDDDVGSAPFKVYRMVAPLVPHVIVTL